MTRIIMIRHGQSQANFEGRFAGHSDFDLTDLGRTQAECAAKYLREIGEVPDVIYSSDLLRAYHTATPVSEAFGLPINKDTSLREIYAGEWEALTLTEIAERFPEDFYVWKNEYADSCPTGGESTVKVYERIVPHVLELAKRHEGGTVFIATHATVVRAFITYAMGMSASQTGLLQGFPKNASISIFNCEDGKASIVSSNMTEHLEGLEVQPDPHA